MDEKSQLNLFVDQVTSLNKIESQYSDWIVYVDESGDHSLSSIDQGYPVFVLSFCVFNKKHYSSKLVPLVQDLKFKHFGHDLIILHENEIRKEKAPFRFKNKREKQNFLEELTIILQQSNFVLITCVIDKEKFVPKEGNDNPYHVALSFCLETLHEFLIEKSQQSQKTHVVVECRGKKEDKELELEFRRICDGKNKYQKDLPFEVIFGDKKVNSSGLQVADLVARPVGLSVFKPNQPNRAFEILKEKLYCRGGRENVGVDFEGWGLKIYPYKSEKPQ